MKYIIRYNSRGYCTYKGTGGWYDTIKECVPYDTKDIERKIPIMKEYILLEFTDAEWITEIL